LPIFFAIQAYLSSTILFVVKISTTGNDTDVVPSNRMMISIRELGSEF
jgi:hypothetical protein